MNILNRLRTKAGFTEQQTASFLNLSLQDYQSCESMDIMDVEWHVLEKLAALYHVEEYDILTGEAEGQTYFPDPEEERQLIPFFRMVRNYIKINSVW